MDASKVQLKTIFRSQSARAAFQSFLHHQFCEENILFYNAVEEYKKISDSDFAGLTDGANTIYNTYIAASGEKEINIASHIREKIQQNITNPTKAIFDDAQAAIYQLMTVDSLPKFIKSREWKEMQGFQGKIKLNKLVEKCMELINPKDYSASSFNQDWNSIEIQELRQKYEKESNLADLEHKDPKIIACLLLSQLNASEHRVIAPELPLFMRIALQDKEDRIGCMKLLVHSLAPKHQHLLHKLLVCLYNLGNASKLAAIFAPLLMGPVPASLQTVSVNEAEKLNVKVVAFLIEHVHQLFEQVASAAHVLMATSMEISRSSSGQMLTPVKDETERLMALYHVASNDWAAKRYENQLKELNALSVTKAELTTRDWAIILTGAQHKTYPKGTVIVKQNDPNQFLYRVESGHVEITRDKMKLTQLGPGAAFGEISILTNRSQVSATISAADDVVLHQIAPSLLFQLFHTDPHLGIRFYKFLATKLCKRLLAHDQTLERTTSTLRRQMSVVKSVDGALDEIKRDFDFVKRFDLGPEEVLIKTYRAHLKNSHGKLYISQNFIGFHAQVFGRKVKELISLKSMVTFNADDNAKLSFKWSSEGKLKEARIAVDKNQVNDVAALIHSLWYPELTTKSHKSASPGSISSVTSTQRSVEDSSVSSNKSLASPRRGAVVESDPDSEEEVDEQDLTPSEWSLILRGWHHHDTRTYDKGEVVMQQGKVYPAMFQIAEGSCRIELHNKVLGTVNEGEIFGEIGLLQGSAASAFVIANIDGVVLNVIDGSYLNMLFYSYPHLAGRFYRYLAKQLGDRIIQREEK
jgi:CRP-like cAMP-binding protein